MRVCGEHMVDGRVVIFAQHDDAGGRGLWRRVFPINFVVWVMIQLDSDAVFALQRHKIWCLTGPCECVVSIWLAVEL